jgi:phosphatidylserine/phosphatidylglycerophosphate/cardiolipin synthase-like enzyme
MLRILAERVKAGVEVKIIGQATGRKAGLEIRKLAGQRLHTRTIISDRKHAFVGSQSLRMAELDSRREVGIIVDEPKVVNGLIRTFEADWEKKANEVKEHSGAKPKVPKKAVKALVKELSPLNPIVEEAVKQVAADAEGTSMDLEAVKATVKEAVKEAVKDRVKEMVRESLESPKPE